MTGGAGRGDWLRTLLMEEEGRGKCRANSAAKGDGNELLNDCLGIATEPGFIIEVDFQKQQRCHLEGKGGKKFFSRGIRVKAAHYDIFLSSLAT